MTASLSALTVCKKPTKKTKPTMPTKQIVLFIGIMIAQQSIGQTISIDSSRCFTPAQEKKIIRDLILFDGCKEEVVLLNQIVAEQGKKIETQDSLITDCSKQLDLCNVHVQDKIKQVKALKNENEQLKGDLARKRGVIRALTYICVVLTAVTATASYFVL